MILGGVFTLSLVSSYSGGASVTSMAFALAVTGGVATPWAVGMRVRSAEFSREQAARACAAEERHLVTAAALAQAEAQEARLSKIADLEAASAQLARDVHDVVGHSLAVILAQAEAAQFQQEPRELHQSMTSIASSARRSLGEIREVLSRARAGGDGGRGGDLDQLIASLRASGVDVQQRCDGTPRALPPELEQVAYRVLQEMLTNAMRHGVSGGRIVVQLLWADRLMLQVRNLASGPEQQPRDLGGTGIPGIRTRLEAVGGSFELLCHDGDDAQVVVATAWLPLRSQG